MFKAIERYLAIFVNKCANLHNLYHHVNRNPRGHITFNPLTTGPDHIRFYLFHYHITYQFLNIFNLNF